MGTEKVKKEEVVQRSQLDNKSPIQVPAAFSESFLNIRAQLKQAVYIEIF